MQQTMKGPKPGKKCFYHLPWFKLGPVLFGTKEHDIGTKYVAPVGRFV